jgi:hypothetical protein
MSFLPSAMFAFSAPGIFITVFIKAFLKRACFNPLPGDQLSMGQIEGYYPDD